MVRTAAIRALKNLGSVEDLPLLAGYVFTAASAEEREALKQTVTALANRVPEIEKRAGFLLQALSNPQFQTGMSAVSRDPAFEILAGIGGKKALAFIFDKTKSRDPLVRSAAVRSLAKWVDFRAAPELLAVCKASATGEHQRLTFESYVNLTIAAPLSPQKKLRMFKDVMTAARDVEQEKFVLSNLGYVKLYETLDFLEPYLGNAELQAAAADAAAYVILPQTGENDGLYGTRTAQKLKKAIGLTGDEYLKEQCVQYLKTMPLKEPPAFVALFNGRDLNSWKGLMSDPPTRARLDAKALAKLQRKADKKMRRHWKVKKGVLCFDGKGHSLCTKKDYKDFEMSVEWKIGKHGDSGIYLRGSPQVQIWDIAQWPEGSGGLYNNKKHTGKRKLEYAAAVEEALCFRLRAAALLQEHLSLETLQIRVPVGLSGLC